MANQLDSVCMWYVEHGYFAYVNETSFAYPEHLIHEGVAVCQGVLHITEKSSA